MFEIDSTPFPIRRYIASKYDEKFSQLRPGQCLKVDPNRVATTQNSLRRWLRRKGRNDVVVRSSQRLEDGYGRVWMLPKKTPTMADLPIRKVSLL